MCLVKGTTPVLLSVGLPNRMLYVLNHVMFNVLKNPNPLKDVEASALLVVAVLV